MAPFLKKSLEKRRNRASSSDESSTSPEAKKPRSGNTDLSVQTEEKDHDKIFAAPNMAEGQQETLNEISRKLKKLDDLDKIYTRSCLCGSEVLAKFGAENSESLKLSSDSKLRHRKLKDEHERRR